MEIKIELITASFEKNLASATGAPAALSTDVGASLYNIVGKVYGRSVLNGKREGKSKTVNFPDISSTLTGEFSIFLKFEKLK